MEEEQVREGIDALIEYKEQRIKELQAGMSGKKMWEQVEQQALINALDHGVNTLLHLKHNLRLCGCPPEAYETKP